MGISVTKAGPYFASGEIKFSQLRANFKETSSGEISASELFRNLNLYDRDPITPDATENDQIASDPFQIAVTWTRVYGPDYVAGQNYVELMPISNSYPSGSFNFYFGGALVGTLDIATATNTYIQVGAVRYDSHNLLPDSYSVVNADGHVPGQNYVELTAANSQYPMGTFKYYWGGVLQGTLAIQGATVDYVQNGDFRYKGGTLQSDGTYSIERSQNINANFYTISKLQGAQGSQTGPFEYSGQGKNLKASQFRNSIKRYTATQSGTDQFLDMGLKSGSGGIDWDGTNNLDASGVGGNYGRNVQKIINIEGTAYSDDLGTNGAVGGGGVGKEKKAGAKLVLPNPLKAINARIHVKSSGAIFGAGGKGGFFDDTYNHPDPDAQYSDPGKDGGPALSVSHEGVENPTYIHNEGGKIYGGGGGGEQGKQGPWDVAKGISGCNLGTTQSCSGGSTTCTTGGGYVAGYDEGCHGSGSGGSCGPGEISASLFIASFPCPDGSGYGTISATYCYTQTCVTTPVNCVDIQIGTIQDTTMPEQGRGGRGGDGAGGAPGYGYYQPRTDGQSGTADVKASCSNGAVPRNMRNSDYGGEGSNGGNWGAVGGSNLGVSPAATGLTQGQGGGRGGSSICGKYYLLQPGYDTAPYIYGPTKLQCDGTESPEIPVGNLPSVTVNPTSYVRFNYGELDGTATQTLNVTGTIQVEIQRQIMERLDGGSNSGSIDGWGVRGIRIKRPDGSILWENIINNKRQSEYPNGFTAPESSPQTPFYQSTGLITLTQGVYPVEFIELNAANKAGTDSNGFDYLLAGRILEMGQKLIFRDGSDIDRNQVIRLKSAGTSNQWVRSYDSNKHDTLKADGTYEFVAMHYYWSQFMRDHAVWENNDDPKTQNGSEPSFENAWSFNPGVDRSTSHPDGGLRLRAQSDNDCQFFMDQSFPFAETEKYCTAGSLCHSGNDVLDVEIPYGFSDGLVVSMRVVCHNRQPLSITWNTINAPGYVAGQNYVLFTTATQQYPRGTFEYYWGGVKVGTLDIEGSSITYIESEDGNYRYDSHTQVDPNQNFYTISRLERNPLMNWAENPAGVAFKIYYKERVTQPDGSFIYQDKDVLYSSNLEQAEGSLWGSASITYTASGVNITDPVQGIDGFSSPPDAAYDIPNKLTVGSDEVRARPIKPTTYTVRARNRVGNATDSTNIL